MSNTLRALFLLLFIFIDTKYRSQNFETPLKKKKKIEGASVIERLHKPRFCFEIHYTHARYR